MKIDTQKHDVSASGMMNQRKFTVDAGAHIMAVLSGLYKNPVDAMIREYLTNMYDAYVALRRVRPEADIVPPILHLPTALDGNLTFRDFGVGMSMDTVWNVYATYGASTKNGSNDEVGGFGLGSKTAFCYNGGASWTIESRYEGMKHIFMAFIGEDGVPNLSHVTSVPTDELSGLTISIPVRREDHRQCIEAANKYVPYFPMAITVEGATINPVSHVFKTERWAMHSPLNLHRGAYAFSRIIMGNVPYVIDMQHVVQPRVAGVDDWTVRDFIRGNSIDFYVGIGDVDIVPSRDDMKYTDRTKKAIQNAFAQMFSELSMVVTKTIDACDTEWSSIVTYQNMRTMYRLQEVVKTATWRGKSISLAGIDRVMSDMQALDSSVTMTRYAITDSSRATPEVYVNPPRFVVSPTNTNFVVIDDLPKGGATIARALIHQKLVHKTHSGRTSRYGHSVGDVLLFTTKLTKDQIGAFLGGLPPERILTTSELKGVTPVPKNLTGVKDTIYRWSGTSWDARVNIPTGTKFYYLPLSKDTYSTRFTFVSNRYGSQKDAIATIRTAASDLGMQIDTIYGVKSTDIANFDASWINLVDAMETELVKQITANAETFALSRCSLSPAHKTMFDAIHAMGLEKTLPDAAVFAKEYTQIHRAKSHAVVVAADRIAPRIPTLAGQINTITEKINVPNLNATAVRITEKYPMVTLLVSLYGASSYGNDRFELLKKNSTKVLDYIALIG